MIRHIALTLAAIFISGCTAIPKINSAGSITNKEIIFPLLGQKVFAILGGTVHLKTAYMSGYKFSFEQPYQKSVQLGLANISVEAGEALMPSILEGVEHHCVTSSAYKDLIGFTNKNVCFYEEKGKFTKAKYAPGIYWFTTDLVPPVDTIKNEIIVSKLKNYAKKELVYDGSTIDGNLMFIEREYTDNLTKPSKIRPVIIKMGKVPSKIEISGAVINILEYAPNSITFNLEKSFE